MFLVPIFKTRAASFLNGLKNIPQRACPSGLKTMVKKKQAMPY